MPPADRHAPPAAPARAPDPMPLNGIDHVELYVGNAAQAAHFYEHAFGFRRVAYAGLETGLRDRTSHVLEQGRIRLVLTGTLALRHRDRPPPRPPRRRRPHDRPLGPRRRPRPRRGRRARRPQRRGARTMVSDEHGQVRRASIATYGDTLHTFIDRSGYDGPVPPRLRGARGAHRPRPTRCCWRSTTSSATSSSATWRSGCSFYEDVFGMVEMIHFSDEAISTEYSALMSKVVASGNGRIKFPINEPAEGQRKSQIDEYLEFYEGAGAQHIARRHPRHRRHRRRAAPPRRRVPPDPRRLLRRGARPGARGRRTSSTTCTSRGSSSTTTTRATCCRSSRSRSGDRPDRVLRDHRAPRSHRLRRRQLQGPVRGDRARAGPEGEPLMRYATPRRRPGQAPRPVPRRTATLLTEEVLGFEGFSGNESILYHLCSPCRVARDRRLPADRARRVGARDPRPPPDRHQPGRARRRLARRRAGSSSSTTTSRSRSASRRRTARASTATARATRSSSSTTAPAPSRRSSATSRTGRTTTS